MNRKGSEKGGRAMGFSGGIIPFPIITRSIFVILGVFLASHYTDTRKILPHMPT